MKVADTIEDGVPGFDVHEEIYQAGVNIQIRKQSSMFGLPSQLDRQIAGDGGGAHSPFGSDHPDDFGPVRRNYRTLLAMSNHGVP